MEPLKEREEDQKDQRIKMGSILAHQFLEMINLIRMIQHLQINHQQKNTTKT